MSRPLDITLGRTSRGGQVTRKTVTWSELIKKLNTFKALPLSVSEYLKLTPDQKGDLKDKSGFFIGGYFSNETRKKAALLGRSVVTLDVDALASWDWLLWETKFKGIDYAVHTSASHTPEKPKIRLVFPLTRDVSVEEYEPLARRIAQRLGIDAVDKVSYRPSQLMYNPAKCEDSETFAKHYEGKWVDPDKVLASYKDWRDFGEWPHSTAEENVRLVAKEMEDPCTKGGAIGAFCTAFDIHRAIEHFKLPYYPTDHENRYTPEGASGSQGAVVYPSDSCEAAFLYSHHSQDVAASKCLNAWDLVRLCKFASMSEEDSYAEMLVLARSMDEVKDVVEGRHLDDFDVVDNAQSDNVPDSGHSETKEKVKGRKINYETLSRDLEDIRNAKVGQPDLEGWMRQQAKFFITKLAGARLDPSDEDVLLGILRDLYEKPRPSKEKLHGDIKKLRKQLTGSLEGPSGEMSDIEMEIIGEVLKRYYGDGSHIRRVGKQFWIYDGGVWRATEDEQVKGKLLTTVSSLRVDRPEDLMTLVAAVGESATSAIVGRLFSIMPAYIARKNSDRDPLGLRKDREAIVNVLNGELHLDKSGTFELKPHDPDNFLTSQIPVVFNPEALCPEWNQFCEYIFQDSINPTAMQEHLEEIGGYLIQPTRWLRTWLLFHGRTGTGKTTIGKVFGNLLGLSAAMRPMSAYNGANTHAEAGLVGKLLLLDEDFEKGAVLPDGFIKKISEAKELTANPKGKDEFSFTCRALPMIISNSWPVTKDASDALIDRAIVWHLERQFLGDQRSDVKADRMVKDELPGILNRFLEGFERLRRRGAWSPPMECLGAREMWISESNSVGRFVAECVVSSPKEKLLGTDLWTSYTSWMQEAMPGNRRIGRNEFYDRCSQSLGPIQKSNGIRTFNGFALRQEAVVDF